MSTRCLYNNSIKNFIKEDENAIFGNEIKYENGKIIVDKHNYHDLQGKTSLKSENALKDYIVNIYSTLMTRGIMCTYVYVCDEQLRDYLKEYF